MIKVALIGNPNSGKTTLFNTLTGSTAHVGNWPGVTVEKKSGLYKKMKDQVEIVDLPGIYSLSPYTPEEIVSRNFLLNEKPDLVINIVDATNLERNLYLTTQVMEIDVPVIVALNMIDVVTKNKDKIDIKELEAKLGLPVVSISALKGDGIASLMERAVETAKTPRKGRSVLRESSLNNLFSDVEALMVKNSITDSADFHIAKLIEGDPLQKELLSEIFDQVQKLEAKMPLDEFEGDFSGKVADARYGYITKNFQSIVVKGSKDEGLTKSDKIDKVLTHRIWGIPIFIAIMFLVFHLTFSEDLFYLGALFIPEGSFDIPFIGTDAINSPGVILQSLMMYLTDDLIGTGLADLLSGAYPWVRGLVVGGLWSGVSTVLSFVPQIMCLFLFISILEDSGYMARVAFIMDRAFRKFGLSGKAFMPLLMCFGCAVPGIMATRTLENSKERRLTIMLTPFFSCGAKLPIWGVFAAILFAGSQGDLVVFSMYLLGIVVSIVTAIIIKKFIYKGETSPFIMELPAYHLPQFRNVAHHLWDKFKFYLVRAATVIAGAVVVIWFLSSFNFAFQMVEDQGDSMIGIISKGITWLFVPLGFGMGAEGWKFVVAAFTGLIAKEMVPATLGTFVGMEEDAVLEGSGEFLRESALAALIGSISIPAAFSFMAFNLLSVPCMAAVGAAKAELSSRKHLFFTILFWLLTSYIVSLLIYWCGTYWFLGLALGVIAVGFIVFLVIYSSRQKKKALV